MVIKNLIQSVNANFFKSKFLFNQNKSQMFTFIAWANLEMNI